MQAQHQATNNPNVCLETALPPVACYCLHLLL